MSDTFTVLNMYNKLDRYLSHLNDEEEKEKWLNDYKLLKEYIDVEEIRHNYGFHYAFHYVNCRMIAFQYCKCIDVTRAKRRVFELDVYFTIQEAYKTVTFHTNTLTDKKEKRKWTRDKTLLKKFLNVDVTYNIRGFHFATCPQADRSYKYDDCICEEVKEAHKRIGDLSLSPQQQQQLSKKKPVEEEGAKSTCKKTTTATLEEKPTCSKQRQLSKKTITATLEEKPTCSKQRQLSKKKPVKESAKSTCKKTTTATLEEEESEKPTCSKYTS